MRVWWVNGQEGLGVKELSQREERSSGNRPWSWGEEDQEALIGGERKVAIDQMTKCSK